MHRIAVLFLLALFVPALVHADEAEDAIKALEKLGARVSPKKGKDPTKVDFAGKPVTDDQLKHLAALPKLRIINLGNVKTPDAKYAPKQIGDKGLVHLADLTQLRELMLDGTHVTDAGLKHLSKLKLLESITLSSTKVTDEGMKVLAELKKLRAVNLDGTKVTDKGIAELKKALGPDANVRK